MNTPSAATQAPLHIGAVALKVRDLARLVAFYRDAIGLAVLARGPGHARLGAGATTLLELEHAPSATPDNPTEAGLYHTAFLQPTRADLARWLIHAARRRVPLTGASDHGVSEAIYLDDPEGNGIEVYRDRQPGEWRWEGDLVTMTTEPLDLDALAEAAGPDAESPADGLRIGHIHLRVGDLGQAEAFYRGIIGLDLTRRRPGAAFMSSGHYHHHVATNIWHSDTAGARDPDRAGLAWFSFRADPQARAALLARIANAGLPTQEGAAGVEITDPWGTRIRIV